MATRVTTHQKMAERAAERAPVRGRAWSWAARATRDAVFWVGVGVNALLALNLLAFLVGLHTGDVSVSWE